MLHQPIGVFFILLCHWSLAQNNEGDLCVESYTQTVGRCTLFDNCESARQDYIARNIQPTLCKSHNNKPMVCCRDGASILDISTPQTPTETKPQASFEKASLDNRMGVSQSKVGITSLKKGDSCVESYTQTVGRCTLFNNCESAKQDYIARNIQPTLCEYHNNKPLVCCRDGASILDISTPQTSTETKPQASFEKASLDNRIGVSQSKVGITSLKRCRDYSRQVTETVTFPRSRNPTYMEKSEIKCEYYNSQFIFGGEKAQPGEFPHMVAIGWPNFDGGYNFDCGGSLISERFVLTAGHCTYSSKAADPKPAVVRLGDLNLDPNVSDGANPVEIPIRNIYKHPEYNSSLRYNDIALLKLATDVEFNNYIRPACLWADPDFGNRDKALATGWGVTETGHQSNDLLKVKLEIIDNVACNISLSNFINRKWRHGFAESQMCAGGKQLGKDTCQGDSGSPLQFVTDENRCVFNVIGITSFGPRGCGYKPAVFTRVSSFVGWIESVVWPNE